MHVSSLWPTLDGKIDTSKKTDRSIWTENLVQKKFHKNQELLTLLPWLIRTVFGAQAWLKKIVVG